MKFFQNGLTSCFSYFNNNFSYGSFIYFGFGFSPKHLEVGYKPKQPIPFSHAVHVSKVGLDCRYYSNVEKGAHSNIPSTETCMNCHKNVKVDSKHIKKLTKHMKLVSLLNG